VKKTNKNNGIRFRHWLICVGLPLVTLFMCVGIMNIEKAKYLKEYTNTTDKTILSCVYRLGDGSTDYTLDELIGTITEPIDATRFITYTDGSQSVETCKFVLSTDIKQIQKEYIDGVYTIIIPS